MSIADDLKKLADLRDNGILTEEEFAAQKAKLLGGSNNSTTVSKTTQATVVETPQNYLSKASLTKRFATVTETLPSEIRGQVVGSEAALFYESLNVTKKNGFMGCAGKTTYTQWIIVTTDRVVFRAFISDSQKQNNNTSIETFVDKTGAIKLQQISYVGVSDVSITDGCNSEKLTKISINSSGGIIDIRAPSRDTADRVVRFLQDVLREPE